MKLPPEAYEFAEQVALIDADSFDRFLKVAAGRGRPPADVAHVLNAYVNQWVRKGATPSNVVGALVALLEPEKRDRLNAASWTIKKWVQGKRADMLKAAAAERKKRLIATIAAGAVKFLARTPEDQKTVLEAALAFYREKNPVPDVLTSIRQAVTELRRPPSKEIIGLTSSGYGMFIAEELAAGRWLAVDEDLKGR